MGGVCEHTHTCLSILSEVGVDASWKPNFDSRFAGGGVPLFNNREGIAEKNRERERESRGGREEGEQYQTQG